MDGFLRTDAASNLLGSPTSSSYMADDAASTCNLINPSPPTNALVNPLPLEREEAPYDIVDELATKLQQVKGGQKESSMSKLFRIVIFNNDVNY